MRKALLSFILPFCFHGFTAYAKDQCAIARDQADLCCSRPELCLTNSTFKVLATLSSNYPAESIGGACNQMEKLANAFTLINGILAAKCTNAIVVCKKSCSGTSGNSCGTLNNYAIDKVMQAVAARYSEKIAVSCQRNVAASVLTKNDFGAQLNGDPPPTQAMSDFQPQPISNSLNINNSKAIDEPEEQSEATIKSVNTRASSPNSSSLARIATATTNHSPSGYLGEGSTSVSEANSLNTNIYSGLRTGGGYSPRISGGYMRNSPAFKRMPSGLVKAPAVGRVHQNIFDNISNRYRQVCIKRELLDCP